MDKKLLLKRFAIPGISAFIGLSFLVATFDNIDSASWYKATIDDNEETVEHFSENYNPYSPTGHFLGNQSIVDNSGILNAQDRHALVKDMEAIYKSCGIQFVYTITSPEEGDLISSTDMVEYVDEIFDEFAAYTSDAGDNLYLVSFVLRNDTSEYITEVGPAASELIDLMYVDYTWNLDYAVDDYDDKDCDYGSPESNFVSSLKSSLWTANDFFEDPIEYYNSMFKWDLRYYKEYVRNAVLCGLASLACFGVCGFSLTRSLRNNKRANQHDIWNNELLEFSNFSVTSGFDDIDSDTNPYHDLVAKYGGFDTEDVRKEVKEEG